jgi:hypothetical protein
MADGSTCVGARDAGILDAAIHRRRSTPFIMPLTPVIP